MLRITDDQWTLLIEDVAEHFNNLTLKRGFQYYKQNQCIRVSYIVYLILFGQRLFDRFPIDSQRD